VFYPTKLSVSVTVIKLSVNNFLLTLDSVVSAALNAPVLIDLDYDEGNFCFPFVFVDYSYFEFYSSIIYSSPKT